MNSILRRLLDRIYNLHQRIDEEERELRETKAEFDQRIARMELQAQAKRRRVQTLELQVKAVARRQPPSG